MKIQYRDNSLDCRDVITHLSFTGAAPAVFRQIILQRELLKLAREKKLTVTDEQVQAFADQFRTERDLLTAMQMADFLRESGLTEDEFGTLCEETLLAGQAEALVADEKALRRFFLAHRMDFDAAEISVITVADEGLAREICMRIREDGEDFRLLAEKYSSDVSKQAGGFMGRVGRGYFDSGADAKVFNAEPGAVLGPFPCEAGFQIVRLESVTRADQNGAEFQAVLHAGVIEEWLEPFLKNGVQVFR